MKNHPVCSTWFRRAFRSPWTLAIAVFYGFVTLVSILACDIPEVDDELDIDTCRISEGTAMVEGKWRITARGTRSGCRDEKFDGEFTLDTRDALVVVQSEDLADVALASPLDFPGGTFTLDGSVRGTCVDFEARESYDNTADTSYIFSGRVTPIGNVSGEFTGTGPNGCETSGSFEVIIQ